MQNLQPTPESTTFQPQRRRKTVRILSDTAAPPPRGSGVRGGSVALAGVLFLVAGVLSGCVSLLPKQDPVQLYTFVARPNRMECPTAYPIAIGLRPVQFSRVARTDGLVTRSGARIANIAGARWAAPADLLFEEALKNAFDGCRFVLTSRAPLADGGQLSVDVSSFEAAYDSPQAAPEIIIVATVSLAARGRSTAPVRTFRVTRRASDNRIHAIASAYTLAMTDLAGEIAAWTGREVVARRTHDSLQHPGRARLDQQTALTHRLPSSRDSEDQS